MISLIQKVLIVLLLILASIASFWKFWFLRNPKRKIPSGNNIISPADGKILKIIKFDVKKEKIEKIKKGNLGKIFSILGDVSKKGYIISIFMSPLDVHYNRAPISGEIIYQKHTKGKFCFANDFENSFTENEKNEIIIKKGKIKIKVIQIAGFLAKRIISYVKKGDSLEKGEIFGLINLGSQVTLILPESINIKVKEGQRVYAGSSIIANFNKK